MKFIPFLISKLKDSKFLIKLGNWIVQAARDSLAKAGYWGGVGALGDDIINQFCNLGLVFDFDKI